jgi:hypothetical protein
MLASYERGDEDALLGGKEGIEASVGGRDSDHCDADATSRRLEEHCLIALSTD